MSRRDVYYKYSWSRRFGIPANKFGRYFYSLKKRTPEGLVEAAADKKSPVHRLFEWNQRSAAHEYRLIQARVMINSLQVEIITANGKNARVVAFIRPAKTSGKHVHILQAAVADLSAAEQRCVRQMRAFQRKWNDLVLARAVITAIDETLKVVGRMSRKAA